MSGRPERELTVPCADCIKSDVCSIRPTLELQALVAPRPERLPAAIQVRVVVECDYFLAAARPKKAREGVTTGKPVRRAAPGPFAVPRPGGAQRSQEPGAIEKRDAVDKRARQIAAVVERHGGDRRAAAAELKMRPQAVGRILTSYLGRVGAAVPA